MKTLPDAINEFLRINKVSQTTLAKEIGRSQGYLSQVIKGKTPNDIDSFIGNIISNNRFGWDVSMFDDVEPISIEQQNIHSKTPSENSSILISIIEDYQKRLDESNTETRRLIDQIIEQDKQLHEIINKLITIVK